MRPLLPLLLLAACAPEAESAKSLYSGNGRDRLCINGERAGFITYGNGDVNCSVRGRAERSGDRLTIIPAADEDCRITAETGQGLVRLGTGPPACSYYCGPGADFSGREFRKVEGDPSAVTDFAGDPLC